MKTIIKLNGKDFDLKLNQNQIEFLKKMHEKKFEKIGDLFERLTEVSPRTNTVTVFYDYKRNETVQYKLEEDACYPISFLFNAKRENNIQNDKGEIKAFFENWDSKFLLQVSEKTVFLNDDEKPDFLTKSQMDFCLRNIKRQKTRAKELFVNLLKESDKISQEKSYYIHWSFCYNELSVGNDKEKKYLTAYFSTAEKAAEIMNKYKSELTWYFTEYQNPLKISIEIN